MEVEAILLGLSYVGLVFMMILLGITGIFPPSKIVYIVAGYLVFKDYLNLYYTIFFGALGHTIGNYIQYIIAKKYGLKVFEKWHLFPAKEIKRFQVTFNRKKIIWLFLGKILDPIKLFISICAAIAKVPLKIFLPIAFIGSLVWAIIFTLFGYYFGKSYESFGWLGLIILVLGGVVMMSFYRHMNSEVISNELKMISKEKENKNKKKYNKKKSVR